MRWILGLCLVFAASPGTAQVAATVTVEPDLTRTMTHVVTVPAPADQVWQAIATIDGWKSWAVPRAWPRADDPDAFETSYRLDAAPGQPDNITNRFIARLPGRIAVFRTIRTPDGFPHAEAYKRVTSFFELTPDGAGTIVRLTGTGYAAGAPGDVLIGFFRDGNRVSLEALRQRFMTGPTDWQAKLAKPAK